MNGAERLLECFRADRLVGPSSEETNFVDLVRSLLRLAGAKGIPTGPGVEKLSQLIGPAEHYVFILVDGMGVDLLEKLPPDGFLRSHLAARLQAVFPSTTASALTTLATAEWPGAHGVPGWWLYLEKFNLSAISLRFAERFSERPLEELGVAVGDVFCVPSVWPRARHAPLSVLAAHIAETTFSRYARGQTAGAGYRDVPEALRVICDRVARAAGPTVTYLYLPQLDALCHRKGTADEAVAPLLAGLEEQLGGLADELAGLARIVIAADHGLVDVPAERTLILEEDDPILSHLLCPPTGEPTVLLCHVKQGREEAFLSVFAERFGEAFVFITPEEADRLRLFGPEPLAPVTRQRLGSLIGLAPAPAALYFRPKVGEFHVHVGVHAGLTPQEMTIPLILA